MKDECSSYSVIRSLVIREWANHKQEGLMLEQVFFLICGAFIFGAMFLKKEVHYEDHVKSCMQRYALCGLIFSLLIIIIIKFLSELCLNYVELCLSSRFRAYHNLGIILTL